MKYQKDKTPNLIRSSSYGLSKKVFGNGLERFILKNVKKDPFLFIVANQNWKFFAFLTKSNDTFKFIEEIINQDDLKQDLSFISRININDFIGGFYQLLDKKNFLNNYNTTISSCESEGRFDIEEYFLTIGKENKFRHLYKERPIDLYKCYLESVLSKIR